MIDVLYYLIINSLFYSCVNHKPLGFNRPASGLSRPASGLSRPASHLSRSDCR